MEFYSISCSYDIVNKKYEIPLPSVDPKRKRGTLYNFCHICNTKQTFSLKHTSFNIHNYPFVPYLYIKHTVVVVFILSAFALMYPRLQTLDEFYSPILQIVSGVSLVILYVISCLINFTVRFFIDFNFFRHYFFIPLFF